MNSLRSNFPEQKTSFDQQKSLKKIVHLDGEEFLPYQVSFFVKSSILNSHATPMAGMTSG